MIYLTESAAYRKSKNGCLELFLILKISHVSEGKIGKRHQDSLTNNPTCKILYTIPGATIEQESRIQKLFEKLRVPKEYLGGVNTREWYWHDNYIINFFSDLKTVDDLENKLKTYRNPGENINKLQVMDILELREKLKKIKDISYKKEKLSKIKEAAEKIEGNPKLSDMEKLVDLIELEDPGITERFIRYGDLGPEELNFLDEFEKVNSIEKGLDLLYSGLLNDTQIENILLFLPESYNSHYHLIGNKRLLEITRPDIVNETLEEQRNLEKEIYSIFKTGQNYTETQIRIGLRSSYLKVLGKRLHMNSIDPRELGKFFSIRYIGNNTYRIL